MLKLRIYVASSWRNDRQPEVVSALAADGHEVYDFRHPTDDDGFRWSDIDGAWREWTATEFQAALDHPIARRGFDMDMTALGLADAVVLVMPCGRSAHLELGYAAGRHTPTAILLSDGEPELMYRMASYLTGDLQSIRRWCDHIAHLLPLWWQFLVWRQKSHGAQPFADRRTGN